MIIIGAKGFAKELLEVVLETNKEKVLFFDNKSEDIGNSLFGFSILKSLVEAAESFKVDNRFVLGLGNPKYRRLLAESLSNIGGILTSTISTKANIGSFAVEIGQGTNIMQGVTLTNNIKIGSGTLINLHCTIGHDCTIGDFCEFSPGVHISGNCTIGSDCVFGTNSTVLPGVTIGNHSIVGAGAVVTKDVPPFSLVVGIPGKVIKDLSL